MAVVGCVVAREETQPASCVAASRLCRHSAQTHTPYNASVLSRVSVIFWDGSVIVMFFQYYMRFFLTAQKVHESDALDAVVTSVDVIAQEPCARSLEGKRSQKVSQRTQK